MCLGAEVARGLRDPTVCGTEVTLELGDHMAWGTEVVLELGLQLLHLLGDVSGRWDPLGAAGSGSGVGWGA